MYPKISVNFGNLVLSLSDALDLALSSLAMHQQRTAFIPRLRSQNNSGVHSEIKSKVRMNRMNRFYNGHNLF